MEKEAAHFIEHGPKLWESQQYEYQLAIEVAVVVIVIVEVV